MNRNDRSPHVEFQRRCILSTSRRSVLLGGAAAVLTLSANPRRSEATETVRGVFENGDRQLIAFPQKRPLMVISPRPPILETPFSVFNDGVFTPNDAFFVRWHLSNIPTHIDGSQHRITVSGGVDRTLSLSVEDLRRSYESVEIAAVNQCSGNSRGFFAPRIAGGQWQNGGMGNARWKGVRLKDILAKAGLKAEAKQVQFDGLDGGVLPGTPKFKKALDVAAATGDDVIVAYEMNGSPMPLLNGYPVRLIVPGWFSTYWVKMLSSITVLDHVDDQFWMKTAYRIPAIDGGNVKPSDKGFATVPISVMRVRSFVTSLGNGATLKAGRHPLSGIAFDGGSGIRSVEYSLDGGIEWKPARLESDFGKYSFRRWNADITLDEGKKYAIACRATGNDGGTQTTTPIWNGGGYMRNAIENYEVNVA